MNYDNAIYLTVVSKGELQLTSLHECWIKATKQT